MFFSTSSTPSFQISLPLVSHGPLHFDPLSKNPWGRHPSYSPFLKNPTPPSFFYVFPSANPSRHFLNFPNYVVKQLPRGPPFSTQSILSSCLFPAPLFRLLFVSRILIVAASPLSQKKTSQYPPGTPPLLPSFLLHDLSEVIRSFSFPPNERLPLSPFPNPFCSCSLCSSLTVFWSPQHHAPELEIWTTLLLFFLKGLSGHHIPDLLFPFRLHLLVLKFWCNVRSPQYSQASRLNPAQ